MKKQNRKAFTIVELVIVIAVIGVLAAVLIPTFSGIIESANRAVDTQLVAQINTTLAIEEVLGGGVNDAVEIQKVIKENGLKLQTKSKGQYIWYDVENKKAVLGGLDENGIVLDDAAAEPALVAEGEISSRGKYRANANSPESFINDYLFISEDSADGFAEAICDLRNSNDVEGINDALETIGETNGNLGVKLTNLMKTVAVITNDGSVISIGDVSAVKKIIVNSELTNVKTSTITALSSYTGVQVVDFHSSVETFEDGALEAIKSLNNVKFCYNSTGVENIDKADEADTGVKNNLISPTERDELFKQLNLVYIDQNGAEFNKEKNVADITVSDDFIISYAFPYTIFESTDISTVYDFVSYSFYSDGSNPIPFDTTNYKIDDYDKILSDEESGVLTLYAVYNKQTADFKIGNNYYGSGAVTYKLANNGVAEGNTITVVSTNATLDASLIGEESVELTIPSGVELLLPYQADYAKATWALQTGNDTEGTNYNENGSKYNNNNYVDGACYDKNSMTGVTNLTVAGNVTLYVENNAHIYVDAACYNHATTYQCYITNNCGVLVLEEGSEIISSGNIKAYGIIRGEGTITANGGEVVELMTLYDWYGGTNAAEAVNNKSVIPFNNWKIEHIKVEKMTINYPTKYSAKSGAYMSSKSVPIDGFTLAGPSDALFITNTTSVLERYTSDDGDMKFVIAAGEVVDAKKTLTIEDVALGQDATIDFSVIGLPLSHMDVSVASGAELTVSYNIYKLLPGTSITVDEGGTLNINTKVLVCNSFDVAFESGATFRGKDPDDGDNLTEWRTVYTLANDRKSFAATMYEYAREVTGNHWLWGTQYSDWAATGNTKPGTAIPMPQTYPIQTPAKFIVKGTLNFDNDEDNATKAFFAGEITSDVAGATINTNGTVEGFTIPHGFYIRYGTLSVLGAQVPLCDWYNVSDDELYSATVMIGINGGDPSALEAGTYTYVPPVETSQGATDSKWSFQAAENN